MNCDEAKVEPFDESENSGGVDVAACVADAVTALSAGGRDTRGRFSQGNVAAGTSLARSEAFWHAVAPVQRELSARLASDLGLGDDAPVGLLRLVDALSEVSIGREGLWLKVLEAGGPVTRGGRKRQLWSDFLAAVGQESKLYQQLGTLPKMRDGRSIGRGDTLEAAIAREPEAR